MEFCERLLLLRTERNVTQGTVAGACGMTLRQYHRFERGEQKPGFDNLKRLADYFDVSVDWLMGRTERREVWKEEKHDL